MSDDRKVVYPRLREARRAADKKVAGYLLHHAIEDALRDAGKLEPRAYLAKLDAQNGQLIAKCVDPDHAPYEVVVCRKDPEDE